MQITSVLVHSLDAAEYSKRCSRSRAFTQDKVNPEASRAGGFASGEERLGVQATLTHCRPLEAHLSRPSVSRARNNSSGLLVLKTEYRSYFHRGITKALRIIGNKCNTKS